MKFERVSKYSDAILPTRATKGSAGYDFYCAEDTYLPSFQVQSGNIRQEFFRNVDIADAIKAAHANPVLVPTGVKCQLDDGYYLNLAIRSSTPLKRLIVLANGEGIIDADYYNNKANEGHIMVQVLNLASEPQIIRKGEKIAQGIIQKYYITEDDNAVGARTGGFGSTSN